MYSFTIKSLRASLVLVGLLLPFVAGAATELVQTPGGLRPKSNVFAVPEGGKLAHVGDEVHLLDKTGKVLHVTKKSSTPINSVHRRSTNTSAPEQSGWITYANWFNPDSSATGAINSFTTTWNVPNNPSTNHGQLLYYFNSIEPAAFNAILQPVLQYGISPAGGVSGTWGVASWYLVDNDVFHTSLVPVSVGQQLVGVITLTGSSGAAYNYNCVFTGITGTDMVITGSAVLTWATETLETYGVTVGSDYPSGSTPFYSIYISTIGGTPSMSWSVVNDATDGLSTTVTTDGATNAEVVLHYPS